MLLLSNVLSQLEASSWQSEGGRPSDLSRVKAHSPSPRIHACTSACTRSRADPSLDDLDAGCMRSASRARSGTTDHW